MKKFLMIFAAVTVLLASCEGPAGPKGDPESYWFVKNYEVNASQWKLINGTDNFGSFYQAEMKIPELTKEIYANGLVFCYQYQNVDGTEVQTPLPFNFPKGNRESLWTEFYFYDFTPGSIMFYVYYSNFMTNNRPPTAEFRVVLRY